MSGGAPRRVVITGQGTVNPLGHDVITTWSGLEQGRCAIGPLTLRDAARLRIRIGAQITDFNAEEHLGPALAARLDRTTQLALVAARQAVAEAGLTVGPGPGQVPPARAGAILGTAGGGLTTQDAAYRAVYEEGKDRVPPLTVPRLMHSAAPSQLSMEFGLTGPVLSVSSACASSNHAMGLAMQMIRAGSADVMLTGGAEAMLCLGGIKAWEGLRVLSPDGCRPFSASRNGMVLGEGAAVFVFEALEHALARGARPLAEVAGFGLSADAGDLLQPRAEGATQAMRAALEDAGLAPAAIDAINAHGTGTAANDRSEAAAIRALFGDRPPPVSATKAMHGHLIGAAGAVELLACTLALTRQILPPTVNHDAPDPACALDVVPNRARRARVGAVLSNAFAFGGLNAVLVLRSPPGA